MTPSVAAASPTVAPAAPFSVVSTAVHDREWWAEEAVRAGTDWSGLVAAALEMMVAAGMVEQPQPETITPWDAPSWREAAAEYPRDRSGRLAVEIEPKRLERLRRFMAHIGRNRATPAVTVEALKLAVREHGPKTLAEPTNQERLRRCDAYARDRLDLWMTYFKKRKLPVTFLSEEFAEACARADAAASVDRSSSRKPWNEGLITAAALQTKQFKPVRIILPDLIPEGVTILAGKPKIGKSWLALDICMAVADENRFVLGDRKPTHGDVLYLALEDNQRRLKKRIDKIVQGQSAWPMRFALRTEWRRIDQGGLEDIEAWCKSVMDPRLAWIDTLAKMRPVPGRHEQAYAADYRAIEGVQRLAGHYQVGIVFNHHLRKMSSEDDAFDDVSGTLGLTGAADTIIVMKRHSGLTKIIVRGRDLEEAEFAAEFNRSTCRWRIVGGAEDVFRSQERQTIIAALKQAAPDPISISDIMAASERRDRNATKSLLHKMKTAGEVISERGRYSLPPTDPLNSVDCVDREPVSASAVNQGPHNATVSGMANGQRNGQRAANGQRSIDQALTGTKTDKPLNAASDSNSGQQVNAVNGLEHSKPADDGLDIPNFLRRPALGSGGRCACAPASRGTGGPD